MTSTAFIDRIVAEEKPLRLSFVRLNEDFLNTLNEIELEQIATLLLACSSVEAQERWPCDGDNRSRTDVFDLPSLISDEDDAPPPLLVYLEDLYLA